VTAEIVKAALGQFSEVYECLTPFERKELARLVLPQTEVGDRRIVLELQPIRVPELAVAQSRSRSEPPNWLPGQVSGEHYYRIQEPASL
jgi:hypothetical protein